MDTGKICGEFNATLRKLITLVERKSRKDEDVANLDRLRKRINLAISTVGADILIMHAAPFFIEYSDEIIAKDEKLFLNMNPRDEFVKRGGKISKQDEFIFILIGTIRDYYSKINAAEKDSIFADINKLLQYSIEYTLAINSSQREK